MRIRDNVRTATRGGSAKGRVRIYETGSYPGFQLAADRGEKVDVFTASKVQFMGEEGCGHGKADYTYHLAVYKEGSRIELSPAAVSFDLDEKELGALTSLKDGDVEYFGVAAEIVLGRIADDIVEGELPAERVFALSLAQARLKHLKDGIANGASPVAASSLLRK